MVVYRISDPKYCSFPLTASGCEARWNADKQYVLYTGSTRALSTLELAVRRNELDLRLPYKLLSIYIDDDPDLITEIKLSQLPDDWRLVASYPKLRALTKSWYDNNQSLILKVSSAVIPEEFNYLFNTKHPDYQKVQLLNTVDYAWDKRLIGQTKKKKK